MKQKSLRLVKKNLWDLFAPYIKKRDKGCITCPRKNLSGQNYNAGHGIAGSVCGVVLFHHPFNVNGQCSYCNNAGLGEQARYKIALKEKLGYDIWPWFEKIRKERKNEQWDRKKLLILTECLKTHPEGYERVHAEVYGYPLDKIDVRE